jgi:hypothetical protein
LEEDRKKGEIRDGVKKEVEKGEDEEEKMSESRRREREERKDTH